MKKNLPITDNEVFFTEELISTTDLKGAITDYNAAFKRVSGFDDSELRGHNHNVVRHPDMPPAAFQDLWDTLKQKQHWMGLVKNRTRTGDFYWVDAYVTPILENGEVTGYESVRVKPDPELVARASKIYAQLNAGKKPALTGLTGRLPIKTRADIQHLTIVAVTLLALALLAGWNPLLQFSVAALAGIGAGWLMKKWVFASLDKAVKAAREEIHNPLMALIYTGSDDEIGQIALVNKLTQAKLRTVLGRLRHTAEKIDRDALSSLESQATITGAIRAQAQETDQVATAMTEMSASIHEVATNASQTAEKAHEADQISRLGGEHACSAIGGLEQLDRAFEGIANEVARLEQDASAITPIVRVISEIAEQTNLLALNAAIEAARAGEHGRGFSVVADEVRKLARRTQESTEQIAQLIKQLDAAMTDAVRSVADTKLVGQDSRQRVQGAIDSLSDIATKVRELNDLNTLMATAVEEQSAVSEDINRNVVRINEGAEGVMDGTESLEANAQRLADESRELFGMINRFRSQ